MQFSDCAEYPKGPRGCSDLTGEFCTSPSETVLTDWGRVCKSRKRRSPTLEREASSKAGSALPLQGMTRTEWACGAPCP